VNAVYFIIPLFSIGGAHMFTDGQVEFRPEQSQRITRWKLIGDYFLIKRTDIGAYQRAAGDATVASIPPDSLGSGGAAAPDASTIKNQVLVPSDASQTFVSSSASTLTGSDYG
jgi:general bacterial porin, GBP family